MARFETKILFLFALCLSCDPMQRSHFHMLNLLLTWLTISLKRADKAHSSLTNVDTFFCSGVQTSLGILNSHCTWKSDRVRNGVSEVKVTKTTIVISTFCVFLVYDQNVRL